MHTQADQLSNPQSSFINRGAPAGYTTQQGYPPAPVSPQHGITSQRHITSTTPLQSPGGRNSIIMYACMMIMLIINFR